MTALGRLIPIRLYLVENFLKCLRVQQNRGCHGLERSGASGVLAVPQCSLDEAGQMSGDDLETTTVDVLQVRYLVNAAATGRSCRTRGQRQATRRLRFHGRALAGHNGAS